MIMVRRLLLLVIPPVPVVVVVVDVDVVSPTVVVVVAGGSANTGSSCPSPHADVAKVTTTSGMMKIRFIASPPLVNLIGL